MTGLFVLELRMLLRSRWLLPSCVGVTLLGAVAVGFLSRSFSTQQVPQLTASSPFFGRSFEGAPSEVGQTSAEILSNAARSRVVLLLLTSIDATVAVVFGAILGSRSIAGEVERDTLALLRTGELTRLRLLVAKVGVAVCGAVFVASTALPAYAYTAMFDVLTPLDMLVAVAEVVTMTVFGVAVGVSWSVRSSSVIAAAALSVLTVGCLVGGVTIVNLAQLQSHNATQWLTLVNPLAALATQVAPVLASDGHASYLPGVLRASSLRLLLIAYVVRLPTWLVPLAVTAAATAVSLALTRWSWKIQL